MSFETHHSGSSLPLETSASSSGFSPVGDFDPEFSGAAFRIMSLRKLPLLDKVRESVLFKPLYLFLHTLVRSENAFTNILPDYMTCVVSAFDQKKSVDSTIIDLEVDEVLLSTRDDLTHNTVRFNKVRGFDEPLRKIRELEKALDKIMEEMQLTRPLFRSEKLLRNERLLFPLKMLAHSLKNKQQKLETAALLVQQSSGRKGRRLPYHVTQLMQKWLESHPVNPYPSPREKYEFAKLGNISHQQVEYWFSNARARLLREKSLSRYPPST